MKTSSIQRFFIAFLTALIVFPASGQVSDYREIKYPALPEFKIPKPEIHSLKNGLKVLLMEDHELPLVQISSRILTGSNYEPAEKAGLASLVGSVQRTGGTARMTGDQIDDFLAARAASIETGIGSDSGFASMDCLKQDIDDVLKVFAEILRTPAFNQDKLDIAKVTLNSMIARRNDDVGEITSREIARIVFGPDSPLARNQEYATIQSIARDDLINWHKNYYHPNNIMLGIVGDFRSAEMMEKIERAFGDWAQGPAFIRPATPYRKSPAPGYYFIEKSDVNQVNIALSHLGIETKNPDYFAVQIMNEILGGGFSSRMFSNVRSQKGLAYSVYGTLGAGFFEPGLLRSGLQTKSENLTKAIEAMKTEISGMIDNPATPEELKRAKDSILNSFVFNYDSKRKVLSQRMIYAYYGLPDDFLEQYRSKIEKVTVQDVALVAKKYLHPDQLSILVVGKAAEFDQPLEKLGKVTAVDISIPSLPDTTPKAEKTGATLEIGKKLWYKAVKTMAGDAMKKAQATKAQLSITLKALKAGDQEISIKQNSTIVFPDKVRLIINTPMGEQTVVFNGDEGFVLMGNNVQNLPAAMVQEQIKDRNRELVFLVKSYDNPMLQAVGAGEETLEGTPCQILAITFNNTESRLWIDPDAKVLKQSYQGNNPITRAPGKVEVLFSDYRKEGELFMAHKQTHLVDGKQVMTVVFDSIEINPKVDPTLFNKPAK